MTNDLPCPESSIPKALWSSDYTYRKALCLLLSLKGLFLLGRNFQDYAHYSQALSPIWKANHLQVQSSGGAKVAPFSSLIC
jgi:hypothetical protein